MSYAQDSQMAFVDIIEAAEEADRERADLHRAQTQQFFDALTHEQRIELSRLFAASEWVTCQALSAAAGDWLASQSNGVKQDDRNGSRWNG